MSVTAWLSPVVELSLRHPRPADTQNYSRLVFGIEAFAHTLNVQFVFERLGADMDTDVGRNKVPSLLACRTDAHPYVLYLADICLSSAWIFRTTAAFYSRTTTAVCPSW